MCGWDYIAYLKESLSILFTRQDTNYCVRNYYVLFDIKWFMLGVFCLSENQITIREVTDSYFLAASVMLFFH